MRDYIFHGKCKGIDKWVEGTGIFFDGINTWLFNHSPTGPIAYNMENFIVEPESVGQYTGMNDKNGRKIFEGDIIRLDEYVKSTFDINDGVVKYGWGGFYIGDFSTLNSLNALATFDGVLRGEVIGNMFENTDLLEG